MDFPIELTVSAGKQKGDKVNWEFTRTFDAAAFGEALGTYQSCSDGTQQAISLCPVVAFELTDSDGKRYAITLNPIEDNTPSKIKSCGMCRFWSDKISDEERFNGNEQSKCINLNSAMCGKDTKSTDSCEHWHENW